MAPEPHRLGEVVEVFAPGRVNLIGDHTDYTGGLVLPMAIELGTRVSGHRGGSHVRLHSDQVEGEVVVPTSGVDPRAVVPRWGRYVAAVVEILRPATGLAGSVSSTLPLGAGLSSSAALEVAVALALGFQGSDTELALACQRAETAAVGVPCGVMDQLTSVCGVAGHALLIDCWSLEVTPVALPGGVDVVVIDSGERRTLADSAYATRREECARAERVIGPLRLASAAELTALRDPSLRARARHVITENERVREFATRLGRGDFSACGQLMVASHRSLAQDFGVSTPGLDELVRALVARPGVFGARLTGAGFGGCVVALSEPGALEDGWHLHASGGAHVR